MRTPPLDPGSFTSRSTFTTHLACAVFRFPRAVSFALETAPSFATSSLKVAVRVGWARPGSKHTSYDAATIGASTCSTSVQRGHLKLSGGHGRYDREDDHQGYVHVFPRRIIS